MADDLRNRGDWTEKWGVSKEQLAEAVRKAGVSAEAVARHLGRTP